MLYVSSMTASTLLWQLGPLASTSVRKISLSQQHDG